MSTCICLKRALPFIASALGRSIDDTPAELVNVWIVLIGVEVMKGG
jgi:hypothetical protein